MDSLTIIIGIAVFAIMAISVTLSIVVSITNSKKIKVILDQFNKQLDKRYSSHVIVPEEKETKLSDIANAEGPIVRYRLRHINRYMYFPAINAGEVEDFLVDYAGIVQALGSDMAISIMDETQEINPLDAVKILRSRKVFNHISTFIEKWTLNKYNPENITIEDIKKLKVLEFLKIIEKIYDANIRSVKKKGAQMLAARPQHTKPTLDTFIKGSPKSTDGAGRNIVRRQSPESTSSSKEKQKQPTTRKSRKTKGRNTPGSNKN